MTSIHDGFENGPIITFAPSSDVSPQMYPQTPDPPMTYITRTPRESEKVQIVTFAPYYPVGPQTYSQIPGSANVPVSPYFLYLNWSNGYENWPLCRFATAGDGSCLFHGIANAFFVPYRTEILNGKHMLRLKIISNLRKELSEMLSAKMGPYPNSPSYYDKLNNSNTAAFASAVPEFQLEYMKAQLDSSNSIGYGYIEFIGNALNKDIYILEGARRDIYVTDELPYTIRGDRNAIVLYYINGHYELVGLKTGESCFETHFSPSHSFIQFLRERVRTLLQ
jgi:hypothetical protein